MSPFASHQPRPPDGALALVGSALASEPNLQTPQDIVRTGSLSHNEFIDITFAWIVPG